MRRVLRRSKLRAQRQWLWLRTFRKGAELRRVTAPRTQEGVLLFCVLRNEAHRLPEFLDHYRRLGVSQFFCVDNASTDGSGALLAAEPDVALWRTGASYREARFGMDWADALKRRYGRGRWCVTVDADELLIYPHHDTRPLPALTAWLDDRTRQSFSALLLDLYPGPEDPPGDTPLGRSRWFDSGNYRAQADSAYGNDWIQGGPRERVFFGETPEAAPALNKIPLVKWQRGYAYVSSTHHLLPRGLNRRVEIGPTGVLLHTKFQPDFVARAVEEAERKEHFQAAVEYRAYAEGGGHGLWHPGSCCFDTWRQVEDLGLMSRGAWA